MRDSEGNSLEGGDWVLVAGMHDERKPAFEGVGRFGEKNWGVGRVFVAGVEGGVEAARLSVVVGDVGLDHERIDIDAAHLADIYVGGVFVMVP